jgi:hypothetical protein
LVVVYVVKPCAQILASTLLSVTALPVGPVPLVSTWKWTESALVRLSVVLVNVIDACVVAGVGPITVAAGAHVTWMATAITAAMAASSPE